jgi:hypothetical protein
MSESHDQESTIPIYCVEPGCGARSVAWVTWRGGERLLNPKSAWQLLDVGGDGQRHPTDPVRALCPDHASTKG